MHTATPHRMLLALFFIGLLTSCRSPNPNVSIPRHIQLPHLKNAPGGFRDYSMYCEDIAIQTHGKLYLNKKRISLEKLDALLKLRPATPGDFFIRIAADRDIRFADLRPLMETLTKNGLHFGLWAMDKLPRENLYLIEVGYVTKNVWREKYAEYCLSYFQVYHGFFTLDDNRMTPDQLQKTMTIYGDLNPSTELLIMVDDNATLADLMEVLGAAYSAGMTDLNLLPFDLSEVGEIEILPEE